MWKKEKKLEPESNIWMYPEEVPISQRGEVLISLPFLVLWLFLILFG